METDFGLFFARLLHVQKLQKRVIDFNSRGGIVQLHGAVLRNFGTVFETNAD
jgi:hypothetical protein